MKKLLSVLSAMALLLATLTMGGLCVGAANPTCNLIKNGNFEDYYNRDWVTWQSTMMTYGAALHGNSGAFLIGNGGWGSMLTQTVSVTLGKAYHLEFWYKVIDNGFNWRLDQAGAYGLYETRWETAEEWTLVTYDFVAASEYVTLNFCGSGNGISELIYVDDVVLTPAFSSDFDGYLFNGDFERGDLSSWQPYQYTTVSTDAACLGEYGAHLQGNGGWGALLEQTFPTKAGVEYIVYFSYKVNQNGFNLQIKDSDNYRTLSAVWLTNTPEEDEELPEDDWFEEDEIGDAWLPDGWAEGALTFVAEGTETLLNICGGGNGIPEDAYIDDVYICAVSEDDLVDDGPNAWKQYIHTTWSAEAAHNGGYGIHLLGDGGWGALAERTLATVAGETYYLSFWYQVNNNGFNLNIRNAADNAVIQTEWYTAAEWTYVEIEFIAPSDAVTLNFCGGGNGITEDAYLDEVVLGSDVWEETPDANIYNGDFETGSYLGWAVYQNTTVNKAAAYSGEYGALLMGNGGWGALLEQGFFTPGFNYALTFRYKVLSEGFNLRLVDGDTDEVLAGGWYTSTEWEEVTLEFTTLSNTMRLNICGGGTGIPEMAYIDDVSITCLDEEWGDIELPTMRDAVLLQQYLNGWDVEPPIYSDLNLDGESNNKDLVLLIRYLNGWYDFTE